MNSQNAKKKKGGDGSLGAFLQDVALITDQDQGAEDDAEKVSLMTVHLAKGLEFPFVFIVGLEESLFPSMMAMDTRNELEEERRLFYVALTRAEVKAYLTFAHIRFRWGKTVDTLPSRFIDEIDQQHLDMQLPDHSPFQGKQMLPELAPRISSIPKFWRPEKKVGHGHNEYGIRAQTGYAQTRPGA